jgi:hypothetical protein
LNGKGEPCSLSDFINWSVWKGRSCGGFISGPSDVLRREDSGVNTHTPMYSGSYLSFGIKVRK